MNAALRLFARRPVILPLILVIFTFFFGIVAHAAPATNTQQVLMISIDGLKPEYITQADAHGMKIPYLRTLLEKGTYADGVIGIWPTVTYPSHTTLITGVWPAEHGIYNNHQWDPELRFDKAWNWYTAQIRVPTLWQVAHRAGLRTASVGWPVSVGATDVDYLIPEYWRGTDADSSANPDDQLLMAALARPDTLIQQLEPGAGSYMNGNDTSIAGDETKTKYTLEILRRFKPGFMTLHLSSLDSSQHKHGPFSPEACADLEALDGMVERLAKQLFAGSPNAALVIVSDHGFMNIYKNVNLAVPFIQSGLIQGSVDPATHAPVIKSWKAEPWMAGGMAAIMLHDPNDQATKAQVKTLLDGLVVDPANGIVEVLDHDEIVKRGGFPDAAFLVVLKPGYYTGEGLAGPLITPSKDRGSHGFSPEDPEMHSSFFAVGAGIARHRDLGTVDMRQIAPTVAGILHVKMPTAKAAPLHVAP